MAGSCGGDGGGGGGGGGGSRVPAATVLLGKREEPLDTDRVPAGGKARREQNPTMALIPDGAEYVSNRFDESVRTRMVTSFLCECVLRHKRATSVTGMGWK